MCSKYDIFYLKKERPNARMSDQKTNRAYFSTELVVGAVIVATRTLE
jgi:hypothetical protein